MNEKIEKNNEEIISRLYSYKEYPIMNGEEIDAKVDEYIEETVKP